MHGYTIDGIYVIPPARENEKEWRMSRYTRMATLNAIYDIGLVVVFSHADPEVCIEVAKCCAEGGARLLEYTNRADFAYENFIEIERYCRKSLPELITGVGSIVDPHTAALYLNNGANFVVGPVFNAEVAKTCNRRKIPYSPGCGSASEVSLAEEHGCEIVKVFPGEQVGGPGFVSALRGPCPWASVMPTGGVEPTEASLAAWFKAGIVAAGLGSKLVTDELLKSNDYEALTAKIRDAVQLVRSIKSKYPRTHAA